MEVIDIPQLLKAPERKREIALNGLISGLETLTPIRGILVVRHGGNFLEVLVEAETIVTLSCDRCLQNYNHRLAIKASELIWLEASEPDLQSLPQEREVALEELSEVMPPDGQFISEQWLYEQFSLAFPFRRLCGDDCSGAAKTFAGDEEQVDSRWSSLASLKSQLAENQD